MKEIFSKCKVLVLVVGLLSMQLSSVVVAETIAVIGTGSVGAALGPRFADIGYDVIYGSRTPDSEEVAALISQSPNKASAMVPSESVKTADIVLLAVPWNVAEQVTRDLGDLSGKIILDPINPRVVENGIADYPSNVSIAERIQEIAPDAMVVKAFNTISSDTMRDPSLEEFPFTIPLVGNDADAKAKVASILDELGFQTIDFGAVRFAHIVEGFYLLRTNARQNDVYFEWAFPLRQRAR